MKCLLPYLFVFSLILGSCQGPKHNFNRQKFTKLKHLKSENEQQSNKENLSFNDDYLSYDAKLIEEPTLPVSGEESSPFLNPSRDGLNVSGTAITEETTISQEEFQFERSFKPFSNKKKGINIDPGGLSIILIILGFLAIAGQAALAIPVSTWILWPIGVVILVLMLITLASFIMAFILKRKARKNKAEENGDRDGIEGKNYQDARDYLNLAMFSRALVTLCFIMAFSLELFFSFGLIITGAVILGLAVFAGLIFNVWSNMNAAVSMAKHVKSDADLTRKAKAIRFFLWLELVYVGLPMLFIPLIISLIKVSKIRKGKA